MDSITVAIPGLIYRGRVNFIEKNFSASTDLKGVFTLGEDNVETIDEIKGLTKEITSLTDKMNTLQLELEGQDKKSGKLFDIEELERGLQADCWNKGLTPYKILFKEAFKGVMGSKKDFTDRVLLENSTNNATLLTLEELQEKAEAIFAETPSEISLTPTIDFSTLQAYESNTLLKKPVVGKDNVDIAGMIKKLGNSDWVRTGRHYYDVNNGSCPFCQQSTNASLSKSLNEFFDESFEKDTQGISALHSGYRDVAQRLYLQVLEVTKNPSKFMDVEKMKSELELFAAKVKINLQMLEEKKKEPSKITELDPIANIAETINSLINETRKKEDLHNTIVKNLSSERKKLTSHVWKFILESLKVDLEEYKKKRIALDKAVTSINTSKEEAQKKKKEKSIRLEELEGKTTSIQPACDGINKILKQFGFLSFSLSVTEKGPAYVLKRPNGENAKETLSDGEKTFVTFLYFYYLLKGSNTSNGITADRIVVIDDPVSSLDSDVLFVVSSLIKKLFADIKEEKSYIKQVLVLTHNVYFHKEVTYRIERLISSKFWTVRKSGMNSVVQEHEKNPISTSYELLWEEIRNPDPLSLTLQNSLRRILEHYFKILGGVEFDDICDQFEGNDKLICKSLFSWVHDGSHGFMDNLHISADNITAESYLKVFEDIFRRSKHGAHYNMMMKKESIVLTLPSPNTPSQTNNDSRPAAA